MNMPGFTAENSVYATTTSYRMATGRTATTSSALVEMSAKASRFAGRVCARISNGCTASCNPYDYSCRDGCNDLFFNCYDILKFLPFD
jgi:hypothetical protein